MKSQRGFTIAELIIVVIIAGVLAAIAAPNMSEFVKNNARATRVNTMVSALSYARGQAVSRNARVSLCKSAGPLFDSCVGTGDFATGWIVFTDGGVRGTVEPGDLPVLRIFQPDMGGNASLVGIRNVVPAPIAGLSYDGTGLGRDLLPAAGAVVSPSTMFRYCDDRGAPKARAIVISPSGSPSLTRDTDGDGTDDIAGTNLVCP